VAALIKTAYGHLPLTSGDHGKIVLQQLNDLVLAGQKLLGSVDPETNRGQTATNDREPAPKVRLWLGGMSSKSFKA
jgi:hypothetical protein